MKKEQEIKILNKDITITALAETMVNAVMVLKTYCNHMHPNTDPQTLKWYVLKAVERGLL